MHEVGAQRFACCCMTWLGLIALTAAVDGAESELPCREWVAATINLTNPIAITHYDISLRTDLGQNRLFLETYCTVTNLSNTTVSEIDFDLLKDEHDLWAKVEVKGVWTVRGTARSPCKFQHRPFDLSNGRQSETSPVKILHVSLVSPLQLSSEIQLRFEYSITVPDPAKGTGLRLIAQLPSGDKEVCLIDDSSWLPRPFQRLAEELSLGERNFFTTGSRSTWRIDLTHPITLESLVLNGRMDSSKPLKGNRVSRYACVYPGRPQLLIGGSERLEIPGQNVSVVFLLPASS